MLGSWETNMPSFRYQFDGRNHFYLWHHGEGQRQFQDLTRENIFGMIWCCVLGKQMCRVSGWGSSQKKCAQFNWPFLLPCHWGCRSREYNVILFFTISATICKRLRHCTMPLQVTNKQHFLEGMRNDSFLVERESIRNQVTTGRNVGCNPSQSKRIFNQGFWRWSQVVAKNNG